ncbi:hypothetical protein GCM10010260_45830 [Streptomyces filipinensis]|uniref:Uncharacterized protein n=1 Tax=Streptomyces filipinensis TaxID=66887 RepID=A0A918MBY2_9ACTN|nr:hypothetical protein GCM10010260_45830 [Streptomyces filipinensis]
MGDDDGGGGTQAGIVAGLGALLLVAGATPVWFKRRTASGREQPEEALTAKVPHPSHHRRGAFALLSCERGDGPRRAGQRASRSIRPVRLSSPPPSARRRRISSK